MMYTGTIVGIQPKSVGSIFATDLGDTGLVWSADLLADIEDDKVQIRFSFAGHTYAVDLFPVLGNVTAYKGSIIWDGEFGGTVYIWCYKNPRNEFLYIGDWNEDGAGKYDCIIKLKPTK